MLTTTTDNNGDDGLDADDDPSARQVEWLVDFLTRQLPGDKSPGKVQILKGAMRETEADRMWALRNVHPTQVMEITGIFHTWGKSRNHAVVGLVCRTKSYRSSRGPCARPRPTACGRFATCTPPRCKDNGNLQTHGKITYSRLMRVWNSRCPSLVEQSQVTNSLVNS
jgi:hypothetical protein